MCKEVDEAPEQSPNMYFSNFVYVVIKNVSCYRLYFDSSYKGQCIIEENVLLLSFREHGEVIGKCCYMNRS